MLRSAALRRGIWEIGHLQVLGEALSALGSAGIQAIIFKGTALGHTVYADPVLRPRADTDLIIPASARIRAAQILQSLGFARSNSVSCEFLSYEATFSRDHLGSSHHLDVHWRVHYSQLQANLFPYEELLRDARPLPAIQAQALGTSHVHALLLVCLHRSNDLLIPQWAGNHAMYGTDRLIWAYDIHLLLQSMTRPQIDEFVRLTQEKGMRKLCLEPIQIAMQCFHTPEAHDVCAALSGCSASEIVSAYQRSTAIQQRWADFIAIRPALKKLAYVTEHIMPTGEYLRDQYPNLSGQSHLRLGLRRLLNGVMHRYPWKLGKPTQADDCSRTSRSPS